MYMQINISRIQILQKHRMDERKRCFGKRKCGADQAADRRVNNGIFWVSHCSSHKKSVGLPSPPLHTDEQKAKASLRTAFSKLIIITDGIGIKKKTSCSPSYLFHFYLFWKRVEHELCWIFPSTPCFVDIYLAE